MTATALAYETAYLCANEPALDVFDDGDTPWGRRPQLRVIDGGRAGAPATAARSAAEVEVYRRRRFIALVAFTLAVLIATQLVGISLFSLSPGAAPASDSAIPAVHIVRPGDTYAAVAAEFGAANPVAVAPVLRAANGGSELEVGQRLVVDLSTLNLSSAAG